VIDSGGVTSADVDEGDSAGPKLGPNGPEVNIGCPAAPDGDAWLTFTGLMLMFALGTPVAPGGGCWLLACSAAATAAILPLKFTNGWPAGIAANGPNGPGNGRVERRSFSISASFSLCLQL
jgi:hypothetical protein